jgi:hypothetical protein
MKMNGLDPKHYWVNFFIVSFILSMITSSIMYLVGAFLVDITFFKDTSFSVLWLTFVGWAIAQIALTSLVQIFINNSRTATIVGYLLSIFSTIIGEVLSTLIFPIPMTLPLPMLLYPPFALCRIVYYMGWNCSDTRGCYQSLFRHRRRNGTGNFDPLRLVFGVFVVNLVGWNGSAAIWSGQNPLFDREVPEVL